MLFTVATEVYGTTRPCIFWWLSCYPFLILPTSLGPRPLTAAILVISFSCVSRVLYLQMSPKRWPLQHSFFCIWLGSLGKISTKILGVWFLVFLFFFVLISKAPPYYFLQWLCHGTHISTNYRQGFPLSTPLLIFSFLHTLANMDYLSYFQ